MTVKQSKYKGTKQYLLVYCELIQAARNRGYVSYSDIAKIMGLPPTGNFMAKKIGSLLGEISAEEVSQGRPMLSALAKSKNLPRPGEGFFVLANQMGIFKGEGKEEEKQFWDETCESVYNTWKD
jgi:hypothetical protein